VAPLVVGFDLDLTLVDSRTGIAAVFTEVGARTGVAVDGLAASRRLGPLLETEFELWYPPERVPEMVSLFRSIYPDYAVASSPAMPGAAEAVAAVRWRGGRVVVITGKYAPNAQLHLDHLELSADMVVGWAWAEGKTEAMREHGVGVYLGDHPADMAAAVEAGAVAIGLTSGEHESQELTAAGADLVLTSLAEFPAWLDAQYGAVGEGISVGLPGTES
jgi:phosphoglycolate phosphatase-like HAD superfamily hydrolase